MARVAVSVIFALCSVHTAFAGVSISSNIAQGGYVFQRWPANPQGLNIIPVRTTGMSNAYPEYPVLLNAMNQISLDLGYCVNFTIYNPTTNAGQANLIIQNRYSATTASTAGTQPAACTTFTGYTASGGANGQVAIMFGSTSGTTIGGCLDNQRDAMRILVNAMGMFSEYRRDDRASYMTFPTLVDRNSLVATTLQPLNIFADTNRVNTTVGIYSTAFDINSVTMVSGSRFAGTSTPVFTIPSGNQVGQLARLSLGDCNTLKQMYGCPPAGYGPTPVCVDPYASTSGITLQPSPSVLTRTIQCATSATTATTTGTPYQIGAFQVIGLNCDANSQASPTIVPTVTGLAARLTKYDSAQPYVTATTNVITVYAGTGACNYILEFTYTGLPATGSLNQQLTVNIQQTISGVATTVAGLPVTLNLNCAPQFTSVTAFTVGPSPVLASTQTRTLTGTGPNNNIQVVNNPNPNPTAAPAFTGPNTAGANTILPYMVQYYAVFGQTGLIRSTNTGAVVNKVFVSCLGAALVATGTLPMVGTNVLGQIQAVDPEGGSVSYYAWSELLGAAATPGERFDVTEDGIITLTALGRSPPAATVAGQLPPDNSAVVGSGFTATGIATGDNLGDATAVRNALITAVDSLGGKSTIEVSFYLTCGPTA